ncbi:MFS transporter [Variovorax sp. GB1R11]|uniref:MFS transporter n=1 Tax=Variovorax sp. GB1R11 TaxID=3443741 RepID=UPI003F48C0C8
MKAGSPNYRYTIFFMVFVLALINYVDRGAISYASGDIIREYGLDKASWGAVMGYFGYGYMFGALFGGAMADRLGPRKVWIIAGVAWSIFEVATAFAGEIGLMFFGGSALAGFACIRILFGLAEGPAYSIINKTNSNWATQSERGLVVSIGLLSTPLGALLTAPIAVGLLVFTGSWRVMLIVLGVSGLLFLVFFMRVFTSRPEENPRVSAEELALIRAGRQQENQPGASVSGKELPWWKFFRSSTLVFNALGYGAYIYVNFLLLTWTPKYLQDHFGYSLSSLWYLGMIPWVGACFTVLLGGKLSDWLYRRTSSLKIARSWFAAASLVCTALVFGSISMADSAVAVIALMTLGNALNALPNAVFWAVVIDTVPSSRVGTFSGITHFLANSCVVLAPTLTGVLVAKYGYDSMFVAASVAAAVGALAMLVVRPGVMAGPKGAR